MRGTTTTIFDSADDKGRLPLVTLAFASGVGAFLAKWSFITTLGIKSAKPSYRSRLPRWDKYLYSTRPARVTPLILPGNSNHIANVLFRDIEQGQEPAMVGM